MYSKMKEIIQRLFLTLALNLIVRNIKVSGNFTQLTPILNTAIEIVKKSENNIVDKSLICKTWIFSVEFLSQLENIAVDDSNLNPTVIHVLGNTSVDYKDFFMHEQSFDEAVLRITFFGPSKFIPNCQVVFVVPGENYGNQENENEKINPIKKMEELTISITSKRLSRPHKDYLIFVSPFSMVMKNFMSINFMQEIRYKFGVSYNSPIDKAIQIYDGCKNIISNSFLDLFGSKCRTLLAGKSFHISCVGGPPMLRGKVFANGSLSEARGVYYALLEEIKGRANFTFTLGVANSGGASGFKKNGTWYGVVGEVFNREAGIGANTGITDERNHAVDTGFVFAWIRRLFFVRAPPVKTSWKAIIWPLDPIVWSCTILTIILIIPVYYYGALFYFKENPGRHPLRNVMSDVISALVAILLEQSATARTWVGMRIRLMILLWALFCLILGTGYRSKLFQYLTFLEGEPVPRTHKGLITENYKIFFRYYGGIAYKYASNSPDPTLKTISKRAVLFNTSASCLIAMILTDKSACLDWEYHGDFGINTNATLFPHNPSNELLLKSLDAAQNIMVAFVYRKRSPIKESFDMYFVQMMATGLYNKFVAEDWMYTRTQGANWLKSNPKSPIKLKIDKVLADLVTGAKPLTNETLYSSFYICLIGYVAALISYICEVIARSCAQNKTGRKWRLKT